MVVESDIPVIEPDTQVGLQLRAEAEIARTDGAQFLVPQWPRVWPIGIETNKPKKAAALAGRASNRALRGGESGHNEFDLSNGIHDPRIIHTATLWCVLITTRPETPLALPPLMRHP